MNRMITAFISSPRNIVMGLINATLVYATIYYSLYSIKNPVDLAQSSFILLILGTLVILTCPMITTIFLHALEDKNKNHQR